jgi:uncharacterized repeat protein (TIGR01451 family)
MSTLKKQFHSRPRERRPGFRGIVILCLVLAVAGLTLAATASQAAPQACTVVANFEIDGDMTPGTATCVPTGDDWSNVNPAQTTQGGTYQTANKDSSDPSGWTSTGSTPSKTDFSQAYATSRVVNGHFYTFVAWERDATAGTQGYVIEIDNSTASVAADGTPQPNRGSGGFAFFLSATGGSAPVFDHSCHFSSQATYSATCSNSSVGFTGTTNANQFTDPLNNTVQAAGGFFEIALDVTALTGIAPSCPAPNAATVYLRSVTGQLSNGNLKGYMAPLEVAPDSTCVPPPITTTANPGGSVNAPGSTQNDSVTVGTAQAPGVGDVAFILCSPAEVTANGGDCSANGTQVGLAKTLDANGQATSDDVTGATTPDDNAPGKYCWRAEFTPNANDHNYLAGNHTNSTTECFTIVHVSPTISTVFSASGGLLNTPTVGFTSLSDTATLTGGFQTDGQTITFDLYGPYANGVVPDCKAPQLVFTTTGTLNGGSANTSQSYTPTQAGTYVWIASYAGDSFNDSATGQCTDADETVTIVAPDVTLTKTADAATVSAGGQIGFTITASNSNAQGTGAAGGVVIDDPLPAGSGVDWSIDPAVAPAGCSISGAVGAQTLHCTAVDLAPGDSETVHVISGTDTSSCQAYPNTATLTATNSPQLQATDTTTVLCADVAITKTADHSAPVNAGSSIGFTVEVTNAGPGDATGVVLNDALPAGSGSGVTWAIDPAVGTPAQFVLAGAKGAQTLSLASGTVPAGADYKVHLTAATSQTECSGSYDNTATLTTGNANNPNPVSAKEACAYHVDLSVTKAGSPATQDLGQGNITWTIVVKNNGPDTDTGVTIADPMPGGNTFVSATSSQGSCTGGAILNCNLGTMAAGATVTITLVTTPSTTGTQTNTVTVAGSRPETNTANNQATATVQVTAPITPPVVYCVAVSKITPNQLFVGRKTTLTIHLTKHGKPAKGVKVLIKGPKLHVTTKASNAKGIVKQVIKMKKAGIDTFVPLASKHCNTKRVGVTGVFTPPVTG